MRVQAVLDVTEAMCNPYSLTLSMLNQNYLLAVLVQVQLRRTNLEVDSRESDKQTR